MWFYWVQKCELCYFMLINELIKNFPIRYQFCKGDFIKLAFLLRENDHPSEYMDGWERFNEESLPDKKIFYRKLKLENITNKDYTHAQKVWKVFGIKIFGEYYELYVQSNIYLITDVFENFRDKCIEIYKLDPAYFLSTPGLDKA